MAAIPRQVNNSLVLRKMDGTTQLFLTRGISLPKYRSVLDSRSSMATFTSEKWMSQASNFEGVSHQTKLQSELLHSIPVPQSGRKKNTKTLPSCLKVQIPPTPLAQMMIMMMAYLGDTEKNAYYNRFDKLVAKLLIPLLNRQDRRHNRNRTRSRLA